MTPARVPTELLTFAELSAAEAAEAEALIPMLRPRMLFGSPAEHAAACRAIVDEGIVRFERERGHVLVMWVDVGDHLWPGQA